MSIRADVDRGLEIVTLLQKLETELKDIETRLKHAALHGDQVDLADADRDGKQYLAAGTSHIVPVILTADKIMAGFPATGAKRQAVEAASQGHLLQFFNPVEKFENRFESGKKFRRIAGELLGDRAPAFITACLARDKFGIPKSDVKIIWDDVSAKPEPKA